jgi:lysozyme family protein
VNDDAIFARAFAWTLGKEGGFVARDLAEDPGGATNHGISLRFARSKGRVLDLDEDGDVDAADIQLITPEVARAVYRSDFWFPARCDEMAPVLALVMLDSAIHNGVPRAVMLLQEAAGVTPDGAFGPRTMIAVRTREPLALALEQLARRAVFQAGLPNWTANRLGWSRRLTLLASEATRWAVQR